MPRFPFYRWEIREQKGFITSPGSRSYRSPSRELARAVFSRTRSPGACLYATEMSGTGLREPRGPGEGQVPRTSLQLTGWSVSTEGHGDTQEAARPSEGHSAVTLLIVQGIASFLFWSASHTQQHKILQRPKGTNESPCLETPARPVSSSRDRPYKEKWIGVSYCKTATFCTRYLAR